jgi:cation diffusion facilitator family transporter
MPDQLNATDSRAKKGFTAVLVGLLANIGLAAIKTSVGVLGHSPALLADGINSTSDVAYYVVVSIFVRLANKPADDEHPYGHSQLESIGALLVGSFVITTAVAIFWNSVDTIYDLISGVGSFTGGTESTLFVALGTVVLKIALTLYTQSAGRATNNPSITALAYDHRNDIFSALAAVVGIFLGRQGLYWVDPLAGAIVAFVILSTGIEILRESTSNLMDTVPGKVLHEEILSLLGPYTDIREIEEIHAHRFGPYIMINITICIDGSLSVYEGDRISTKVEETIKSKINFVRTVHVHYHPVEQD